MREHLASLVEEFRKHAAETAVVAHRGNRAYPTSYGELAELAGRFAAELERRGIASGERVVLWGENSAEWIGVFFGCLLRGAIAVPLDAAGTAEFAARVIADVQPRLVVGDAHLLEGLGEKRPGGEYPAGEAGANRELKPAAAPEMFSLATIADHLPAEALYAVSEAVGRDTAFQIVFTSGTTAEPRGIVHTHRNILVTLAPIEQEMAKYGRYERIVHPLRFLHSLPLSHVFGQFMGLWCPALLAAEVHFAEQLEPARMIDLIRRERISVLVAVPRVLHLLRASLTMRFPELSAELETPTPGSGVKGILRRWWQFRRVHRALGWKFWAVISGGATLPAELEGFWNGLGYALIQGYGMTETAALVTLNHPFHIAPGTIGKAMPGREVKLTDEGEILVRGEMLSGATWAGGQMHAREGEWLATGDLAARSETGELKFLGRKGDVIVTGSGLNIHPADLEAALGAQPGVHACAVVPCEFAGGPEPVAVAIFAGTDAELETAMTAANRGLAEFQQMRRVLRWPELKFPYTSTGKLIRRQVAEWACGALSGVRSPLSADRSGESGQDALLGLIAEVTGEPTPPTPRDAHPGRQAGQGPGDAGHPGSKPDTNALRLSEDLHLDSLGRVQLQSALEQKFDLELEDDAIAAIATVGQLRELVGEQLRGPIAAPASSQQPAAAGSSPGVARRYPLGITSLGARDGDEHVYPRWPWSWPVRMARIAFIELAMRPLAWLLAKPRVTYAPGAMEALGEQRAAKNGQRTKDNRQPAPPYLIISNHVTAYDGALVLYALPGWLRRRVAAAMSGEMLLDFRRARNQGSRLLNLLAPGAYWLLTALFNVFPLPHGRGFRRSFAHAGEAMDRGYSVLIFPEGTRSLIGRMNPFRPGIGLLAQQSAAPIVPVALVGLYEYSAGSPASRRHRWFHAGRIQVRVGAPIWAATEESDPAQFTAMLEQAMGALMAPPQLG